MAVHVPLDRVRCLSASDRSVEVMAELEKKVRLRLDDLTPWIVIAYFGIVALVVAQSFVIRSLINTQTAQSRDEAVRAAEIASNAQSLYTQCVHSRPTLARINEFIVGVRTVEMTLLQNSVANLEATPTDSAEYPVRVKNLLRLRKAAMNSTVHFPVPSVSQCQALKAAGRKP